MAPNRFSMHIARFVAVVLAVLLAGGAAPTRVGAGGAAQATYVDTHNHLPLTHGIPGCELGAGVETALRLMDRFGISKTLIMPPPYAVEGSCEATDFAAVAAAHPDRFALLAGGESLNLMIQQAVLSGEVTEEVLARFEATALDILRAGAVGFGELTAEHFAFHVGHPYETAPPDHPLLLLLADIAARYEVPIDLHMEALPFDFDDPARPFSYLTECSGARRGLPNPETIGENIAGLERLLVHNRAANIVWVHAGWDNTGHRTVALTRRLMEDYPNLYIQIRPNGLGNRCPPPTVLPNSVLDGNRELDADWLALIRSFPDRFTIGLDSFYPPDIPDRFVLPFVGSGLRFLSQLPTDLARKVGTKNAVRLYHLDRRLICHKPGAPAEKTMWVSADALAAHTGHGDAPGPCEGR